MGATDVLRQGRGPPVRSRHHRPAPRKFGALSPRRGGGPGRRRRPAGCEGCQHQTGLRLRNAWALANGRQSLPAEPQTVALYLGRLAADGRAMATIEQARAAIRSWPKRSRAGGIRRIDASAKTFSYDPSRSRKGFPSIDEAKDFVESFRPWELFGAQGVTVDPEVRPAV